METPLNWVMVHAHVVCVYEWKTFEGFSCACMSGKPLNCAMVLSPFKLCHGAGRTKNTKKQFLQPLNCVMVLSPFKLCHGAGTQKNKKRKQRIFFLTFKLCHGAVTL